MSKNFDDMLKSFEESLKKDEIENFRVFTSIEHDSLWGHTALLHVSQNGYQFSTIGIHTKDQLRKIINALQNLSEDYLDS